jgi:cellulose synthase/poly-beta-1,6-N-acetylglucosamine synthase-like glycosyltransferase
MYLVCSAILLGYGIQCYVLTYLFLRCRKTRIASQRESMKYFDSVTDEALYPRVVTQVPMYNERTVARRIISAVCAMDYPHSRHEIQILDDSNDETKQLVDSVVEEYRQKGVWISAIRRTNRSGYKAGALQNALKFTDADFVAIFDADFVPNPDFLKRSVAFFMNNPKLGLVQGRWTHLNRGASLVTRGQAMGIDGHFMVEQAARSWNNLFMNFNGTAGVFRMEAIESCGGWHHDTLTEDMDLSYRMQLKGWKAEYVPELEVPAEIPEDINAFKNQQFRWAKGSIQTAIKITPLLLKQKIAPFKFIQALLHLTHYVVHPIMVVMVLLTMPVLFLIKVHIGMILFSFLVAGIILATSGPSTMYMVSQHFLGNRSMKKLLLVPVMMLIGTGLAVNNGKAVLEAVFRKQSPFHRTPKRGGQNSKMTYKPLKDATTYGELLLAGYSLICIHFFLGYHNMLVSPFLVIYASGFLFVGLLSIIHRTKPELIYWRPRDAGLNKAPA